jgi:hypothetical protein
MGRKSFLDNIEMVSRSGNVVFYVPAKVSAAYYQHFEKDLYDDSRDWLQKNTGCGFSLSVRENRKRSKEDAQYDTGTPHWRELEDIDLRRGWLKHAVGYAFIWGHDCSATAEQVQSFLDWLCGELFYAGIRSPEAVIHCYEPFMRFQGLGLLVDFGPRYIEMVSLMRYGYRRAGFKWSISESKRGLLLPEKFEKFDEDSHDSWMFHSEFGKSSRLVRSINIGRIFYEEDQAYELDLSSDDTSCYIWWSGSEEGFRKQLKALRKHKKAA